MRYLSLPFALLFLHHTAFSAQLNLINHTAYPLPPLILTLEYFDMEQEESKTYTIYTGKALRSKKYMPILLSKQHIRQADILSIEIDYQSILEDGTFANVDALTSLQFAKIYHENTTYLINSITIEAKGGKFILTYK